MEGTTPNPAYHPFGLDPTKSWFGDVGATNPYRQGWITAAQHQNRRARDEYRGFEDNLHQYGWSYATRRPFYQRILQKISDAIPRNLAEANKYRIAYDAVKSAMEAIRRGRPIRMLGLEQNMILTNSVLTKKEKAEIMRDMRRTGAVRGKITYQGRSNWMDALQHTKPIPKIRKAVNIMMSLKRKPSGCPKWLWRKVKRIKRRWRR